MIDIVALTLLNERMSSKMGFREATILYNNILQETLNAPTVPHRDNEYLVVRSFGRSPYFKELLDRLGREHYIMISGAVYARDDESLSLFLLSYDEEEEKRSNLEICRFR